MTGDGHQRGATCPLLSEGAVSPVASHFICLGGVITGLGLITPPRFSLVGDKPCPVQYYFMGPDATEGFSLSSVASDSMSDVPPGFYVASQLVCDVLIHGGHRFRRYGKLIMRKP